MNRQHIFPVLLALLGSASVRASDINLVLAANGVDIDAVCSDRKRHGAFVGSSLKLAESGTDKGTVLSALFCIATNPDVDLQIGNSTVRALFHIAADDGRRRDLLQRILREDGTRSGVIKDACNLLVYIANVDSRSALLEFVKARWPSTKSGYAIDALTELGDQGLLTWIDQIVKDRPGDHVYRGYFDRVRRKVKIQRSVPEMLAYIEGDHTDIKRRWVIHQAIRHGASRTDVRKAAMAYLRRSDPESARYHRRMTVRACDEVGAFAPEHAQELDVIRRTREIIFSSDPPGPRWATLPDTKRAEFYSLNR